MERENGNEKEKERRENIVIALMIAMFVAVVLSNIEFAINATDSDDEYSVGLRNGLRLAKSYLDGEEPKFETVKN